MKQSCNCPGRVKIEKQGKASGRESRSFLKKRSKKLLRNGLRPLWKGRSQIDKSFLLLFFRKRSSFCRLPLPALAYLGSYAIIMSRTMGMRLNMDAWGYADEKLYKAVLELSRGLTSIQQRLQNAWTYHLLFLKPDRHFPDPDIRIQYKNIVDDIEFLAPGGAGLLALPNEEAAEFATRIVGLFWNVARLAT